MEQWSDFFVATAGAAAALAGLVIVAMSVNVAQIIKFPQLPPRALATIAALVMALLTALAGLAHQPERVFGAETLAFGLVSWGQSTRSGAVSLRANRSTGRPRREALSTVVLGQLQSLPLAAGGALVALAVPGGSYVVFGALLALFAFAMLEAWVLLIEILR
jgi:hypothetical protein